MHAVYPLISGVQGAAAGTARIYARGTTTRAPYWMDFEGTQQVANSADIALDSNGGAEVYVGQLVDVTVFDADGDIVRQFTAGSEAPNVEVRSQSFLGVDYITGASAAGNPTTLQAVLDRALTSFGATNWNVSVNGVATPVSTAVTGLTGIVFNVKSPTYGAAGNGTSDDTSAVQAAITAAVAAGGGTVVFPPGTYIITAPLQVTSAVRLQGVGAGASILKLDHATNSLIRWSAAVGSQKTTIALLGFTAAQVTSGAFVDMDGGAATNNVNCSIDLCSFDAQTRDLTGTMIGGQGLGATGRSLEITRCLIQAGSAQAVALGAGKLTVLANQFESPAGAYAGTLVQQISPDGVCVAFNRFVASGSTSGTFNYIQNFQRTSPGLFGVVAGNAFGEAGGTAVGTVALADAQEIGNTAGTGVLFTSDVTGTTSYSNSCSFGRERAYRRVTNTTGAYTIPDGDGTDVISFNFAGSFVVTVPTFYPGRRGRMYIHNQNGTNRALAFVMPASVFSETGAAVTLNTGTYTQVDWEFIYMNAHPVFRYWVTDANRTPP